MESTTTKYQVLGLIFIMSACGGTPISASYPMKEAVSSHTATLTADNQIIVIGGIANGVVSSSIQTINPATGEMSVVAHMTVARYLHTATLLGDGTIVIIGGYTGSSGSLGYVSSVECFDPKTNEVSNCGSINIARGSHHCVLLDNDKILIAGGDNGSPIAQSEIYNTKTHELESIVNQIVPHSDFDAIKLPNDHVVLIGGNGTDSMDTIEEFNPDSLSYTKTATLIKGRFIHKAILMSDGNIFIAGGYDRTNSLNSAEIYNPQTHEVRSAGNMLTIRDAFTLTLLDNSSVLIAGGANKGATTNKAEIYQDGSFKEATPMIDARDGQTATKINNQIFFVGGYNVDHTVATFESYSLN